MNVSTYFRCSILLGMLFTIHTGIKAQQITVLSAKDKMPVPGAIVVFKHTGTDQEYALTTNANGVVAPPQCAAGEEYKISIQMLGFNTQTDRAVSGEKKTVYLQEKSVGLQEVTVTAQYVPQSAEKSVQRIRVIDAKQIQARGAQSLRELLNNELNIRISNDAVLGAGMSLQGISGENVKIMVDGVAMIGRQNGNLDLNQINLSNIERIEIVEGPMSVEYGTNALAGVINLITKKVKPTDKLMSVKANSYAESVGMFNNDISVGYAKGKQGVQLGGSRNFFYGWNPNTTSFSYLQVPTADSSRAKQWKQREQLQGDLQYTYTTDAFRIRYTGNIFYEKVTNRGTPRAPYNETAFDDYYRTQRYTNSLFIAAPVTKHSNIDLTASHSLYRRYKNTYSKNLTNLDETLVSDPSAQDTSIFSQIMTRATYSTSNADSKLNYQLGTDISLEGASGKKILDTQQSIQDYAAFGSTEYKATKALTIRPGVRYAYNSRYQAPLVPSISVKMVYGKTIYRASYARGFRAPGLKELYFYFIDINHNIQGNTTLKAERSHNVQIAATRQFKNGDNMFTMNVSMYGNSITNLITLAQITTTEYSYINIGKYRNMGAQGELVCLRNSFTASIGGSVLQSVSTLVQNESAGNYQEVESPTAYTPEMRASLGYRFEKARLSLNIFSKYYGRQTGYSLNANGSTTPNSIAPYTLTDFTANKIAGKYFNLSAGIKNLLDVQSVQNTGTATGGAHSSSSGSTSIAFGRTYFVKVSLEF